MTEQLDNILNDLEPDAPKPGKDKTPQQKAAETRKKNAAKRAAESADALEPEGKQHKYKPGQKCTIIVQRGRGKGEDRPVPVTVQGVLYTVPRGVRVRVPAPVAEVLMNAEEQVVEWDEENNDITSRPAASYPTSIVEL